MRHLGQVKNDQNNEIQQVNTNIIENMNRKEVRPLLRDSKAIAIPTTAVMWYFVRVVFWFLVDYGTLSVQPPKCVYRYILLDCLYKNEVTPGRLLFLQALCILLGFVMSIPNWQSIKLPFHQLWQWNGKNIFSSLLLLVYTVYYGGLSDLHMWSKTKIATN